MMINICIGVVSAIIGFMYSRFYKFSGMNRTFLVFWAFCLGYFLCRISTSILISAVNTVFVCFCNYSSYLEVGRLRIELCIDYVIMFVLSFLSLQCLMCLYLGSSPIIIF